MNKPKTFDELAGDGLCDYCPWIKEQHHPEITCEGCCCDEAYENYLEEFEEEE